MKTEPGFKSENAGVGMGIESKAGLAPEARAESAGKVPKTERGRRTLRALLDAAGEEFGEKGFHEASISRITSRAGVAIGSFYTYFDSKEEVFKALVQDLSTRVRDFVAPRITGVGDQLAAEQAGQLAYLEFVRDHNEIYRIIDEAEFVDPISYQHHYRSTAARIAARLEGAEQRGEITPGASPAAADIRAWALMGINVFLGLRFGVWDREIDPAEVARIAGDLIANGLRPRINGAGEASHD